MGEFRVSTRYATSLLALAEEKNQFDIIANDMKLIYSTLNQSKDLQIVLKNPVIDLNKKTSILCEIFENKIDETTLNFVKLVVDKNREDLLFDIVQRFIELYNERVGIVKVLTTSAVELSDEQKKNIVERLEIITKKSVIVDYILDPSIVGGFLVRIGDTVMDASVKHQLETLRKVLLSETELVN